MTPLSLEDYNKKYKSGGDPWENYHFNLGSHGAQKIELYKSLGVGVVTIIAHGVFKRVQKPIKELIYN